MIILDWLHGRRRRRNGQGVRLSESRFKYRSAIESNSDRRAELFQHLLGTRATTKFADDIYRTGVRSGGGRDTFLDGVGNVYGADRILDNGVDNDTAVAVRRDWTAKIFV